MSIRILHAADVHLGHPCVQLGSAQAERQEDFLNTFMRICDRAIEHQVAALLLAGDLFDRHEPPDVLVGQVQHQLERLRNAGVRVYVIPGNHDAYSYSRSVWKHNSFDGAHIFTEPRFTSAVFERAGISVYLHGLAYDHTLCPDPLPTLARSGEGLHIAMLHATVDVPAYRQVEQRYLPLAGSQLRDLGVDYVALGHIHRSHAFADANGIYACYPGSPEGLTARETGDRYVALLEFDGGAPTLDWVKVNRRTVVQARIPVDEMSTNEMVAAIHALANPNALLTATLTGSPREVPAIQNLWGQVQADFFALAIDDQTALVDSTRIEEIAAENTIRGQFVRTMRARIRAEEDAEQRAILELGLKLAFLELEGRKSA